VNAIKQVDIVISSVAVPQHLEQLNIIRAIKEVGNIKVYTPLHIILVLPSANIYNCIDSCVLGRPFVYVSRDLYPRSLGTRLTE
jgi:hypothetical protein